MGLHFANLDQETRRLMLEEVDRDTKDGQLYFSPRLTEGGRARYPLLLRQAILEHDDTWLANELRMPGLLGATETRKTKTGVVEARLPNTAPFTLAEGEFNRFYVRAVCLRSIADGKAQVEVYRAKQVENPRPDSGAKIGALCTASQLLEDLRNRVGIDTALGIPPGPNSGLSVRLTP